ncbi:MAG: MarR family transcriptional regulator [Thermoanaerobaculia bacterium]|nr:MarR family transcriptional regulator [Thermoanaerobaculia bacterium]
MSSRWKGPKSERRALEVWVKLSRAVETVGSRLGRRLADRGVGHTQLGILDALLHLGPMPIAELGAKMLRSPGNMTAAIDRLEKQELVARERDDADRRVIRVKLTPEGKALIEEVLPGHVAEITDAMSALTAEEQATLASLCRKLGLAAAGREPAGSGSAEERPRGNRRKS